MPSNLALGEFHALCASRIRYLNKLSRKWSARGGVLDSYTWALEWYCSYWALYGCYYFLVGSGWLLLLPDGLYIVTVMCYFWMGI